MPFTVCQAPTAETCSHFQGPSAPPSLLTALSRVWDERIVASSSPTVVVFSLVWQEWGDKFGGRSTWPQRSQLQKVAFLHMTVST